MLTRFQAALPGRNEKMTGFSSLGRIIAVWSTTFQFRNPQTDFSRKEDRGHERK
jgi:hypothetical protein